MFLKQTQIEPARVTGLLKAAEAAARHVPPAFPLDATVAVNPFLGQSGEDLARASARLARVAGARLTLPREDYMRLIEDGEIADEDLAAALYDCASPLKPVDLADLKAQLHLPVKTPEPLPSVADLAAQATGTDWPAVIRRSVGLWAAGYFDRGQALWTPAPGRGAFASWREWATHDLTPEIAGLSGFCTHVSAAPDTSERAILRAAETLKLTEAAAETAFHRAYMELGGWAQHARWLLWTAELEGRTDHTLSDLLAIRVIWDEALFQHVPGLTDAWAEIVTAHETPVAPCRADVVDAILQDARERSFQRRMSADLVIQAETRTRPRLQVACCIDVRSGPLRRALEDIDPEIETIGFAGFFGLPVAHRAHGTDAPAPHLPALLRPAMRTSSHLAPAQEQAARIRDRTVRAWGRFRQAAVSSFAFVEAAGPVYGAKLFRDALGLGHDRAEAAPQPRFDAEMSSHEKAALAAKVLTAMSLTQGHAPLVLLLGHGASTTNNPHDSAYHCGACGGQAGDVSARLLAALLNDAETRAGLHEHGIEIAEDTVFVAGLHDTTTDRVTLYPDGVGQAHDAMLSEARRVLVRAGRTVSAGRAKRLPGARPDTIDRRALDWAEVRPEWGLAGCAAFIAAPRAQISGKWLDGRCFLHSYDWTADSDFATLELVLTAPAVVASWISLQYYGSSVAPDVFGGGNKLIHNVTSGIGVVQGNGGILRPGLPSQALHDGERSVHDPLRLSVLIEAPQNAITAVLDRNDDLRALFDHGWMHLFTLKDGRIGARYKAGKGWTAVG
jgi:uncharacterized protein YbcC (UPF0753/DUF2309 family)